MEIHHRPFNGQTERRERHTGGRSQGPLAARRAVRVQVQVQIVHGRFKEMTEQRAGLQPPWKNQSRRARRFSSAFSVDRPNGVKTKLGGETIRASTSAFELDRAVTYIDSTASVCQEASVVGVATVAPCKQNARYHSSQMDVKKSRLKGRLASWLRSRRASGRASALSVSTVLRTVYCTRSAAMKISLGASSYQGILQSLWVFKDISIDPPIRHGSSHPGRRRDDTPDRHRQKEVDAACALLCSKE